MQRESSDNKIKEMMSAAMKDLNSMVDVNTIIGKPFKTSDGKTVTPVSKITFGFITGGGEYGEVKAIKECRKLLRKKHSAFSYLRGNNELFISSKIDCECLYRASP